MITTQINIKPHLAEYAMSVFRYQDTDVIEFPNNEDLHITLWTLMDKRPAHCQVVEGNITIKLPHRSIGKNPMYYNFLCKRSQKIIESKIELRFWGDVHEYVDAKVHNFGYSIIDAVFMFMKEKELKSISSNALVKDYYRWRHRIDRIKAKRKYTYKK